MSERLLNRAIKVYYCFICLSISCSSLSLINWTVLYLFFIFNPSLQVKSLTVGLQVVATSFYTHASRQRAEAGWRQSCEHQHQWRSSTHLWMFEQKCIRHWGARRTIQLSKHEATSFPPLLQACTETSHCLNSTHSIPMPGPCQLLLHPHCRPAWPPEQRQSLTTPRVINSRQRAFIAIENWTHHLETAESAPLATQGRLSILSSEQLVSIISMLKECPGNAMTKQDNYLYWYLKYA